MKKSTTFEANRDLITEIKTQNENIVENQNSESFISKYSYQNDALGRRINQAKSGFAKRGMVYEIRAIVMWKKYIEYKVLFIFTCKDWKEKKDEKLHTRYFNSRNKFDFYSRERSTKLAIKLAREHYEEIRNEK